MTDLIVFPDAVDIVCGHLDDLLGVPVRSKIPKPRPASFVTVRRGGGVQQTIVTDAALLLVECWAVLPGDAMDLAQLTRAHLHAMRGHVLAGVPVYRVDEVAGPADLPDPLSDQARVVITFSIHLRGATAVGS
jgi:hypothetical protein